MLVSAFIVVAQRPNNFSSAYHIFHVIWDLLLLPVSDNEDDVDGAGVRLFACSLHLMLNYYCLRFSLVLLLLLLLLLLAFGVVSRLG